MARSTKSSLIAGILLTILGAVVIDHGAHFGLQLIHLGEMGLAVGAVLGLVPDRAPAWRAGSFAVGFVAAWLGFALRAGLLPDIPLGRAIATVVVLALVTVAAGVSFGRLPLWAGLLGVAAFSGGYETTFSNSPTSFISDSMTDATTIALAVGLGFLAATLVDGLVRTGLRAPTPPPVHEPSPPQPAPPPSPGPLPLGARPRRPRLPAQRATGAADEPVATEATSSDRAGQADPKTSKDTR